MGLLCLIIALRAHVAAIKTTVSVPQYHKQGALLLQTLVRHVNLIMTVIIKPTLGSHIASVERASNVSQVLTVIQPRVRSVIAVGPAHHQYPPLFRP